LSIWSKGPRVLKTPFNPILGEIFRCTFQKDGNYEFLAEQISHHPPSTAFCMFNREKRLCLQAYLKPNSKFCGNSIEIVIGGTLIGHILNSGEVFEVTYPKYVVKGVLFGNMELELSGKSVVKCEANGYVAEFEFKPKNAVVGKIVKTSNGKTETLYHVSGDWTSTITAIQKKNQKRNHFDQNS